MSRLTQFQMCAAVTFALVLSMVSMNRAMAADEADDRPRWKLIFSDDFERAELGDTWTATSGVWAIEDGHLRGAGTLVSTRPILQGDKPQYQRLEFDATTDVEPYPFKILEGGPEPEVTVCDITPFIHCLSPDNVPVDRKNRPLHVWHTGYFFQFGGWYNTRNMLRRKGDIVLDQKDAALTITPNKRHHIIVENDEGFLRMFVDGQLVFQHVDKQPINHPDHGYVGLMFYGVNKVDELKVYVKEARPEAPTHAPVASSDTNGNVALVVDGEDAAPIVVPADLPHFTRQAADILAEYIEKVSGAKPEILEGTPDPVPARAIWVGYQPIMDDLFPGIDLTFNHPEEILLAANGNHVVIAGRDRWDPDFLTAPKEAFQFGRVDVEGYQQEYGTANAVYTFIQDCLNVRWLWPGDLGEDIAPQETIAFAPFVFRYHPQIRMRDSVFAYHRRPRTTDGHLDDKWMKLQRLWLGSLAADVGGHAFGDWWERFHESNPEYFALQPDGTRIGMMPAGKNVKMCLSNPDVAEQWLEDIEKKLAINPYLTHFSAAENDGGNWGYCVCEDCQAWDHPDSKRMRTIWNGVIQDYLSMSDRQLRFANRCAELLEKKYPGKGYKVTIHAYGNSTPAPVELHGVPNVHPSLVHNFFDGYSDVSNSNRAEYIKYSDKTTHHFWRPNVGHRALFQDGGPADMTLVAENMRLVGQQGCIGIYIDYIRDFWWTQGPMYYLLAQMVWNPFQDADAIMDDYYARAYGPAAETMEVYWSILEVARRQVVSDPDSDWLAVFNDDLYERAESLLNQAEKDVDDSPEVYTRRIGFARAGLTFLDVTSENMELMDSYKFSRGKDTLAYEEALANCEVIDALIDKYPNGFRTQIQRQKSKALDIYPREIK